MTAERPRRTKRGRPKKGRAGPAKDGRCLVYAEVRVGAESILIRELGRRGVDARTKAPGEVQLRVAPEELSGLVSDLGPVATWWLRVARAPRDALDEASATHTAPAGIESPPHTSDRWRDRETRRNEEVERLLRLSPTPTEAATPAASASTAPQDLLALAQLLLAQRVPASAASTGESPPPAIVAVHPFSEDSEHEPLTEFSAIRRHHAGGYLLVVAPTAFLSEIECSNAIAPLAPAADWSLVLIPPEGEVTVSPDGVATEATDEKTVEFTQTLERNTRTRRRWPNRESTEAYRLYDGEVAPVPWAVDRYGEWIHVTVFRDAEPWDTTGLAIVARVVGIDPGRVIVKYRQKRRAGEQHDRLAHDQVIAQVHEGPARFEVNLTDYVDTGLFLDHRLTRRWVHDHARDRRVLNLFAYTGAFTVQAALGGARATTSVDTSNVYLEWARRNLELNGVSAAGPSEEPGATTTHRLLRDDCLSFLESAPIAGEPYDLAVVDPPTFSNRRGKVTWDVQRDHARLFRLLEKHLAPEAVVIFSTNFRKFSLDSAVHRDWVIEETTPGSIPPDFHDRRIHRCYRMSRRSAAPR